MKLLKEKKDNHIYFLHLKQASTSYYYLFLLITLENAIIKHSTISLIQFLVVTPGEYYCHEVHISHPLTYIL